MGTLLSIGRAVKLPGVATTGSGSGSGTPGQPEATNLPPKWRLDPMLQRLSDLMIHSRRLALVRQWRPSWTRGRCSEQRHYEQSGLEGPWTNWAHLYTNKCILIIRLPCPAVMCVCVCVRCRTALQMRSWPPLGIGSIDRVRFQPSKASFRGPSAHCLACSTWSG